jgi:hypothetical protein
MNPITKTSLAAIQALMMIAPTANFAHAVQPVAFTGANTTGAVLGEAGDYLVEKYNRNVIEQIVTKHFTDRQNQDAEYVKQTVKQIENQIQLLINEINGVNGFQDMFIKAAGTGSSIELLEYLAVTKNLRVAIQRVDAQIQGLFLIPSAIKSQESVKIDGKEKVSLPAPLKVDLEGIEKFFKDQKAAVLSVIADATLVVKMPNGVVTKIKGYDYVPKEVAVSADELDKLRKEARRDSMIPRDARARINEFNMLAREEIQQAIASFGTSQKYRFRINDEGKEQALSRLAEIFWARDYLRAVYGVQLGAIGITYDKKVANIDFFTSSNKIKFLSQFLTRDADLTKNQDLLATALRTQEGRDQEVFGEGVALLDRMNSGINFVRGEAQLSAINVVILKLLERDTRHEKIVSKPGGMKAIRAEYRNVYYTSDEAEAAANERADQYLGEYDEEDIEQDTLAVEAGTLLGTFQVAVDGLDNIIDRVEQARLKLEGIAELRAVSGGAKKVKKRRRI